MDNFYTLIDKERDRQDSKWGIQRHDWNTWSTILTEECGEVAKACLDITFDDKDFINLKEELVQVSAVCKAIYEHIIDHEQVVKYDKIPIKEQSDNINMFDIFR